MIFLIYVSCIFQKPGMREDIAALLNPDMIEIDPDITFPPMPEHSDRIESYKWQCKELVLERVVDLLCRSGDVRNASKLYKDLLNRERRATTAVGEGLAIPHVRTMQPRDLIMCFIRFAGGIEFMSLDDRPVYFIFGVITPPYRDRKYISCLSWLSRVFSECFWLKDALFALETPAEVREIMVELSGQFS